MNNVDIPYVPRWAASRLHAILDEARVTVLTGARQVGKSTLLAHELDAEWASFSLDELDVQAQVQRCWRPISATSFGPYASHGIHPVNSSSGGPELAKRLIS